MTGIEILAGTSPSIRALALIAIVLLEAVVLYAGYGAIESTLGPTVLDRLAGSR